MNLGSYDWISPLCFSSTFLNERMMEKLQLLEMKMFRFGEDALNWTIPLLLMCVQVHVPVDSHGVPVEQKLEEKFHTRYKSHKSLTTS